MTEIWDLKIVDLGGDVGVQLRGEFDLTAADDLDAMLGTAVEQAQEKVAVTMGDVTYMDSCGLRSLLQARRRAEEAGKDLRVVDPSPVVRRLLEVTDTAEILLEE